MWLSTVCSLYVVQTESEWYPNATDEHLKKPIDFSYLLFSCTESSHRFNSFLSGISCLK